MHVFVVVHGLVCSRPTQDILWNKNETYHLPVKDTLPSPTLHLVSTKRSPSPVSSSRQDNHRLFCCSLSHGTHAQRGLQLLVCKSVCLSVRRLSLTTFSAAVYVTKKRNGDTNRFVAAMT